jgi:hypothetical protein
LRTRELVVDLGRPRVGGFVPEGEDVGLALHLRDARTGAFEITTRVGFGATGEQQGRRQHDQRDNEADA